MQKLFNKWWNLKDEYFVFLTSLGFYVSLYFSVNNKTLLGLFFLFLLIFYKRFLSWPLALFFLYLLFLPFGKGKTFDFLLIPARLINSQIPYTYAFSVTFADMTFLALFVFLLKEEIAKRFKAKKYEFQRKDGLLLIFLLFVFISLFFSQFQVVSFLAFLKLVRITAIYFLIQKLFFEYRLNKLIPGILAPLLIFQGGWAFFQSILHRPLGRAIEIFGTQYSTYGHAAAEDLTFFRPTGTFEHPNTLGSFLVMLLAFFIALFFNSALGKKARAVLACSIFVGFMGLILSASRASWGVLGIIMILEFWFLKRQKKITFTPVIKKGLLVMTLLLVILLPFVIVPRLQHLYLMVAERGGIYYRYYLLEKAWLLALESPLGVGLATFPAVLVQRFGFFDWPTPVHNLLLEILAETGIFSLMAFLLFLIFTYQRFFQQLKGRLVNNRFSLKTGAFFATLGFLGVAQFYPFFWSSGIFEYFWLFLGIMVY